MAQVEVPAELLAPWVSRLPAEVDAALESEWGAAVALNGVELLRSASARILDALPWVSRWVEPAQQFLGEVMTISDAARAIRTLRGIEQIEALQNLALGVLQRLARISGLASSIPIMGMIVQVGQLAQRIWFRKWVLEPLKEYKTVTDAPWVYDRASDEVWCQQALDYWKAGDLTEVFLPRTTPDRLILDRVRVPGGYTLRWQVDGDRLGMGVLPGVPIVARGWQGLAPWTAVRPGAEMLAAWSWSQVMAPSPIRYLIDARTIATRWDGWWRTLREAAEVGGVMEGDQSERWRGNVEQGRVLGAMVGILPTPTVLRGEEIPMQPRIDLSMVPAAYRSEYVGQKVYGQDGRYVTVDMDGGPDLGSMAIWQADVLRQAQWDGLRTLLCAYVSRDDPAFRSDAELRARLASMRMRLLSDEAALWAVDVTAIRDTDLREQVIARRPTSAPTIAAATERMPEAEDATAPEAASAPPVVAPIEGGGGAGLLLILLALALAG